MKANDSLLTSLCAVCLSLLFRVDRLEAELAELRAQIALEVDAALAEVLEIDTEAPEPIEAAA